MLIWPLVFSTFSTSKLVAMGVADLSSTLISFGFSDMPKELFDKLIMFTSLSRTEVLKALLVKHDRLTVRVVKIQGVPPHWKHSLPKGKQPTMEPSILHWHLNLKSTSFTPFSFATEARLTAYCWAVKFSSVGSLI